MLKKWYLLIILLLIMTACHCVSAIKNLPELEQAITLQITDADGRNSLLVIEPLAKQQWRFVQVDTLGAPISRQILQQGKWRNDGFLPPNASAKRLFMAVYAFIGKQRGWSIPVFLNDIRISSNTDQHSYIISWHEQYWQIREVDNE